MLRVALLLLVALSLSGCGSSQATREMTAKPFGHPDNIRITPVKLNEQQIAKLKELAPNHEIAWIGAGRVSDGKLFACHVVSGKNIFGGRSVALFTGTFDADGSYQRSATRLWSLRAVYDECRSHGFDPPVKIRSTYSVMRI